MDVVNNRGWWEQPATRASEGRGNSTRSTSAQVAEMGIYDVNGDGLADVVTAISATPSDSPGSNRSATRQETSPWCVMTSCETSPRRTPAGSRSPNRMALPSPTWMATEFPDLITGKWSI